jgi:hypothetical protein
MSHMTNHAGAAEATAQRIADDVRAELARQKKTAGEMASVLGITAHTAGRRLNGDVPFNVVEIAIIARWLGLSVIELMRRAEDVAVAS